MAKIYVIVIMLLLGALAYADKDISRRFAGPVEETPFDVEAVVETVIHNPSTERLVGEWSRNGEFLIDTNIVYGSAQRNQRYAAAAFDGTNYLVVWEEEIPTGPPPWPFEIYAARVAPDGTVLDICGKIIISNATDDQCAPSVAFNGTNYLVVWHDWRSGSTWDIYGARVSTDGTVLDPNGIALCTAVDNQACASVASDGTNWLVVWQDSRGTAFDIYSTRVSPTGTVLDPSGIPISTSDYDQSYPSVAFDGTNYLVVWDDLRSADTYDIYGARVSSAGAVLDPGGIAITTLTARQEEYPSVAFGGTNYLVVWQGIRTSGADKTHNILGREVSQAGALVGLEKNISLAPDSQEYPQVTFTGVNYLVVWRDKRNYTTTWNDIYGCRVSSAGAVLDPGGIAINTRQWYQFYPAVASDGTNYLVVWHDYDDASSTWWDIYGARLSQTGTVLDPAGKPLSASVNSQSSPSVAFDGTNYLAVWEDSRNYGNAGKTDIYGARVSQTGTVLDALSLAITTATGHQTTSSIAFDGTNYLVVWHDYRNGAYDIYATRVSPAGTVLNPTGIAISTATNAQYSPEVAFDGTNYLVVWRDYRNGAYDIYGTRVSPVGTVLNPTGIAISTATNAQYSPEVAFDGTNYLVVWHDYRNGDYDIYGTRISQAGTVLNPSGIAISTAANSQYSPAVAFDGTNYLVVWHDYRNGNYDIYGTRISQAGTVLNPSGIAISTAANSQEYPAVAFDGTDYRIIWQDYRSGSNYDIYGAKLSTSGLILDSYVVTEQPGSQRTPALTKGTNQLINVYSGFTDYINGRLVNTYRAWAKTVLIIGIAEQRIADAMHDERLVVIPNPFTSFAKVVGHENETFVIYDIQGRTISKARGDWIGGDLTAGVYFVVPEDRRVNPLRIVKVR